MTAAAAATTIVTPRPRPIARLLARWFSTTPAPSGASTKSAPLADVQEDLRIALEMASACQVSALSGEYAQFLLDRHCARKGERG